MGEKVLCNKEDLVIIAETMRTITNSEKTYTVSELAGTVVETSGCVTVTFMDGNEILLTRPVYVGDDCPDPVAQGRINTPEKPSTAQYMFTYNGWASTEGGVADATILDNITENKTVYAVYTSSVRKYTVTYYDDDSTTILHTEQIEYGGSSTYIPTKEGMAFGGWVPAFTPVTDNASYTATWFEVLDGGICGDTTYWSLDINYVLRIYGIGSISSHPWTDTYKGQIQSAIVEEGITYLMPHTFTQCTALENVTIASTVTEMGEYCFYKCAKIKNIYISDLGAWLMCEHDPILHTYSSPKVWLNGENIDEGMLIIPESVTKIGRAACWGWYITGIVFHDGVTKIGDNAFRACHNITNVAIPASVVEIGTNYGSGSFYGCTGLIDVVHLSPVTGVGQYRACSNLQTVIFGDNLTTIAANTFNNCTALSSVIFTDTEGWKAGTTALASSDLANPTTAATYLASTYASQKWTKS